MIRPTTCQRSDKSESSRDSMTFSSLLALQQDHSKSTLTAMAMLQTHQLGASASFDLRTPYNTHRHTHTRLTVSGTTRVSRYQKGKPRQHPTTQFFTGRMPFLPPNQQRQSTENTIQMLLLLDSNEKSTRQ